LVDVPDRLAISQNPPQQFTRRRLRKLLDELNPADFLVRCYAIGYKLDNFFGSPADL
jgi:hypothetical protein